MWPLRNTRAQRFYLSPSSHELVDQLPQNVSVAEYESTKKGGKAVFSFTFGEDTEITGSMALRLWVSALDSDDLDLFVTVHKIDAQAMKYTSPVQRILQGLCSKGLAPRVSPSG